MGAFQVTSQTIARPGDTSAYASGDLVANNTTAGSVTPFLFSNCVAPGYKGAIRRGMMFASANLLTNGTFRIHVTNLVPTVGAGDNGAFGIATNITGYIGYLDVTLQAAGAAGTVGWGYPPSPSLPTPFSSVSGSLWGLIEARAAYVPTNAETFYCVLELENY